MRYVSCTVAYQIQNNWTMQNREQCCWYQILARLSTTVPIQYSSSPEYLRSLRRYSECTVLYHSYQKISRQARSFGFNARPANQQPPPLLAKAPGRIRVPMDRSNFVAPRTAGARGQGGCSRGGGRCGLFGCLVVCAPVGACE